MNAQQQIDQHRRTADALQSGHFAVLAVAKTTRAAVGLTATLAVLDNVKREIVETATNREGWIV